MYEVLKNYSTLKMFSAIKEKNLVKYKEAMKICMYKKNSLLIKEGCF